VQGYAPEANEVKESVVGITPVIEVTEIPSFLAPALPNAGAADEPGEKEGKDTGGADV
jgi:hypothetical protein